MLAKYVPGGVWTPAARVVALRRYGITATPTVLGSIALEAGLSALAGVLVFIVSLPTVEDADAPLSPLVAFGADRRRARCTRGSSARSPGAC